MNDHLQPLNELIREAVQEPLRRAANVHHDEGHREGFARAAGITLRRIQEKLDVLKKEMKGSGLTKAEQAVYAQMDELKSEIEAACDRYWRGTGVDWRPCKPVAKAVARPIGESSSED